MWNNYDSVSHILWPYDRRNEPKHTCDVCSTKLEYFESEDNVIWDGRTLCDDCVSDFQQVISEDNPFDKSNLL